MTLGLSIRIIFNNGKKFTVILSFKPYLYSIEDLWADSLRSKVAIGKAFVVFLVVRDRAIRL